MDSGRSSDTYAETSASSITSSSTNHSNRLNSNASNCSADSGTDLSGLGEKDHLQPVQERSTTCSEPSQVRVPEDMYSCIKRLGPKPGQDPVYARSVGPRSQEGRIHSCERRNASPSGKNPPPPLPARFATIRKLET